nr:MAG TPA: Terminase large subunit [Crassvirales sp.]
MCKEQKVIIPTNEYQTPITEELRESLPKEVWDQLYEAVTTIPFIQNLISPNRKRAKDLERDELGRIKVDLCNPHIIENMDYFREAALYYKENGCYTKLRPNANPNSEYGKWIRRERDRCWYGMVRPEDGEWISGDMYFYLNYSPIMVTKTSHGNTANRVEDFPSVWEGIYFRYHYMDQAKNGGIYNDFKGGNHGAELARRGAGKSYSIASKAAKNFILGQNKEACKRITTIMAAYQGEYLSAKDGTVSKFTPIIDFCALHTGFPKRRLIDSVAKMTWQMGYQDKITGAKKGSLNLVLGVAVQEDEDKLRGKRGDIFLEEFGSFPSLLGLYNTLRPSVEEGDRTFGLIYMIGTSGNKAADFLSAQEIIFNPDGYNIYSLPNVYDKGVVGKRISFFYGAYLNRAGCYNKDGVSDVVKALLQILLNRYKVKYNSSEPDTIIRTIAEMPITPQEAITRVSQNIFPVTLINDRLSEIDTDETILSDVLIGRFKAGKGDNVLFETTSDLPIREYPTKDNTLQGAVEIYKQPVIDPSTGRAYSNRYIASVDPIDDDGAKTMSFFSFFVLDCWTDEIVCEYTGRYPLAEDNYEVARLGTIYYNASLLYENNKKGIYAYFKTRHSTHYMSVTPEYLLEKELIKERGYGNKAYGVNATAGINNYGRALLRDWLLTTTTELQVVDGEEVEVTIPNVMKIKSRALLKELSLWNSEGNFDRVSSCIMLMIKRQEVMIKYGGNPERQDTGSDLADDDFFTKNYPNYQSE